MKQNKSNCAAFYGRWKVREADFREDVKTDTKTKVSKTPVVRNVCEAAFVAVQYRGVRLLAGTWP